MSKSKLAVILLVLAGLALLVAAVITTHYTADTDTARPAPTSSTSAPTATVSAATDQPAQAGVDDLPATASASSNPELSAATPIATRAMAAFLRPRPSTTPARWWATLAPLLTAGARQDYAPTDPMQVAATKITGAAAPISPEVGADESDDEGDEGEVVLGVPTDAGLYAVWVVTEGPEAGKVSRISPAQS